MSKNSLDKSSNGLESEDSESFLDSEIPVTENELPPGVFSDSEESVVEVALQQFVVALKQEFTRERERERVKIRAAYTEHVKKIETEARRLVRERVQQAKLKEGRKIAEREKRINELFRKLNLLARDIAHQKKVLKKSREEFDKKLLESDFIQTELRNLGKQMGEQVDSLGDSLLDDSIIEDALPNRLAG